MPRPSVWPELSGDESVGENQIDPVDVAPVAPPWPGTVAEVSVPATSANLGPGFDSLGLALDWADPVRLEVVDGPTRVEVTGEGAERVPSDDSHLIVASWRRGLLALGVAEAELSGLGVRLTSHNTIPHGRGVGSSSAAIVAGLYAAWLHVHGDAGSPADRTEWLLELATRIEGHPDNVAPAILGGFVIGFTDAGRGRAVRAAVHPELATAVYLPDAELSTAKARGAIPEQIRHADAVANTAAGALLVHAVAQDPSLLMPATEDRLHQDYRAALMPESSELLRSLRQKGFPATISGAGPAVLVLGRHEELPRLPIVSGFDRSIIAIGEGATGTLPVRA